MSKQLVTGGSQACERVPGPDDGFSRRRPALRGLPPQLRQGTAALHDSRRPFEERAPETAALPTSSTSEITPSQTAQPRQSVLGAALCLTYSHASKGLKRMLWLTTHAKKELPLFPLRFWSSTLRWGEKRPRATKDCEINVWPSKSQDKVFTSPSVERVPRRHIRHFWAHFTVQRFLW